MTERIELTTVQNGAIEALAQAILDEDHGPARAEIVEAMKLTAIGWSYEAITCLAELLQHMLHEDWEHR